MFSVVFSYIGKLIVSMLLPLASVSVVEKMLIDSAEVLIKHYQTNKLHPELTEILVKAVDVAKQAWSIKD